MNEITYLNRRIIETLTLFDVYESSFYVYRSERKVLGMTIRKSGIYGGGAKFCECDDRYFVKDGRVYRKPKVVVEFTNQARIVKNFETYKEAKAWVEKLMGEDFIKY